MAVNRGRLRLRAPQLHARRLAAPRAGPPHAHQRLTTANCELRGGHRAVGAGCAMRGRRSRCRRERADACAAGPSCSRSNSESGLRMLRFGFGVWFGQRADF